MIKPDQQSGWQRAAVPKKIKVGLFIAVAEALVACLPPFSSGHYTVLLTCIGGPLSGIAYELLCTAGIGGANIVSWLLIGLVLLAMMTAYWLHRRPWTALLTAVSFPAWVSTGVLVFLSGT